MNYQRALDNLSTVLKNGSENADFRLKLRLRSFTRIMEHPVDTPEEMDVTLNMLGWTLMNLAVDFRGERVCFDIASALQKLYRTIGFSMKKEFYEYVAKTISAPLPMEKGITIICNTEVGAL